MGTDKNIKLHIVTDIKYKYNAYIVKSKDYENFSFPEYM